MWEYAQSIGLRKGKWMIRSGLNKQRWMEFARGSGLLNGPRSKPITPYYFFKLAQGLRLTIDDVEIKSKIKFTKKQRDELISCEKEFKNGNSIFFRTIAAKKRVQRKTKEKSPKVLSDKVYTAFPNVKGKFNHKYDSLNLFIEALKKNKLEIALACLKDLEKEIRKLQSEDENI
jgi:hypothetical protein